MEVQHYTDPRRFLDRAGSLLANHIARNQVLLNVAGMAAEQPDVYPVFHGFLVTEDGAPLAAATQTPPHNFILADSTSEPALDRLVEGIDQSGLPVPGVLGNQPNIHHFARRWSLCRGLTTRVTTSQGVFSLEHVSEPDPVPGTLRPALAPDRDLMITWWTDFLAEAMPNDTVQSRGVPEQVDLRLDPQRAQGLDVWDVDGAAVAMSGHSAPVQEAVRIGPVYTPPPLRGNGYATALVAAQSRRLLEAGATRCLLHTDLANPTSNAIYQRIGYRKIAEAAEYSFG